MRRLLLLVSLVSLILAVPAWAQSSADPRGVRCCAGVDLVAYVGYPRTPTAKCHTKFYVLLDWPPFSAAEVVTVEARPRPHLSDQFAVEIPTRVLEVSAMRQQFKGSRFGELAGLELCADTFPVVSPTPEGGSFAGQGALAVYRRAELLQGGGVLWLQATPAPGYPQIRSQRLDLVPLK
jgi:hypothetical protein